MELYASKGQKCPLEARSSCFQALTDIFDRYLTDCVYRLRHANLIDGTRIEADSDANKYGVWDSGFAHKKSRTENMTFFHPTFYFKDLLDSVS